MTGPHLWIQPSNQTKLWRSMRFIWRTARSNCRLVFFGETRINVRNFCGCTRRIPITLCEDREDQVTAWQGSCEKQDLSVWFLSGLRNTASSLSAGRSLKTFLKTWSPTSGRQKCRGMHNLSSLLWSPAAAASGLFVRLCFCPALCHFLAAKAAHDVSDLSAASHREAEKWAILKKKTAFRLVYSTPNRVSKLDSKETLDKVL